MVFTPLSFSTVAVLFIKPIQDTLRVVEEVAEFAEIKNVLLEWTDYCIDDLVSIDQDSPGLIKQELDEIVEEMRTLATIMVTFCAMVSLKIVSFIWFCF